MQPITISLKIDSIEAESARANHTKAQFTANLTQYVETLSREDIINFLQWNDGNGIFTDELAKSEGLQPMTHQEAKNNIISIIIKSIF